MKSPPFAYTRPTTRAAALAVLESEPDARPLAGGQSLLPLMGARLAAPAVLVDLERVEGLSGIQLDGGTVRIGAMTRQADAEASELLATRCPVFVEGLRQVGYPAIRNRGTIGGSLAHADPAAELPVLAVALDASMLIDGPAGPRTVAARDFFRGPFEPDLHPGELLTAVELPANELTWAFHELARRSADFALVSVAVGLRIEDEVCREARVVVGAAHPRPIRLQEGEEALVGARIDRQLAEEVATRAVAALRPAGDVQGSSGYRRQVAAVLLRRAIVHAAGRSRK
ncbi:FAD binding domain-containing protein [Pseudonocardia sp.]|uniref:FAD binding domain-containing protein n=1 Tax=Pseudonocardia sp. TaxID=60912 RepID=UPI003D0A5EE7